MEKFTIAFKTKVTKNSDNTHIVELEGSGFTGTYCCTSLGVAFEFAYQKLMDQIAAAILKE